MWIPRTLEPVLKRLSAERPAVVLTGARQTGKTSLVRRVFPDHTFVSLDLPSEAEQAEKEPAAFLSRHRRPLVVDEVQYAPGLFRHLKVVLDAERERNGQFILTGSQKFALMQRVSESLAGRVGVLDLEGLTFSELRRSHRGVDPAMAALRGTMPELWEKPDLDMTQFHRAYVTTYLERDLRQMLRISNLRDFERFLRACAIRSAQLLNKAELARDVGISPSTAGEWLAVLEASNQVVLLEPWFSNKTKTLSKSPKLYLADSGLMCYLLRVSSTDDLAASPLAGAIWETFVCGELRRQIQNGDRPGELFFWRDRTKEADFLIHRGGRFELYDAKWSEHPSSRDAMPLVRIASELPQDAVLHMGLICRAPNSYPIRDDVQALSVAELATAHHA